MKIVYYIALQGRRRQSVLSCYNMLTISQPFWPTSFLFPFLVPFFDDEILDYVKVSVKHT